MERMYANKEKLFTDEKAVKEYVNQWKIKSRSLDTKHTFD